MPQATMTAYAVRPQDRHDAMRKVESRFPGSRSRQALEQSCDAHRHKCAAPTIMNPCPHDDSWLLVPETFIIGSVTSLHQPIRIECQPHISTDFYREMPQETQIPITAPNARPAVEIRRAELLSSVAQSLIRALNKELESRYPEDNANFFRLDPDEVREGCGGFFVAYMH